LAYLITLSILLVLVELFIFTMGDGIVVMLVLELVMVVEFFALLEVSYFSLHKWYLKCHFVIFVAHSNVL
jgi:hypothetical protein